MSVEFNERKPIDYSSYNTDSSRSGISGLIIKLGLAKDEKGAQKIMIGMTVIFFALAIYFFAKSF